MITKKDRFIQKLNKLSMKYVKMSFLFNELAQSLKIKFRGQGNDREFRKYIKEELKLDIDKIIKNTNFFNEFKLNEGKE